MPNADGPYGFIRATLGDIPAFIAMWCYWVSLWITNAAIATGVVGYLGAVFPSVARMQPALVALALLWTFVIINLFGVRTGGRVQVVTTALKLLADARRRAARWLAAADGAGGLHRPPADGAGGLRPRR